MGQGERSDGLQSQAVAGDTALSRLQPVHGFRWDLQVAPSRRGSLPIKGEALLFSTEGGEGVLSPEGQVLPLLWHQVAGGRHHHCGGGAP